MIDAAKQVWNCDETAFTTETTSQKALAKGCKGVYEVGGGSKREHITVHHCGSATGEYLLYLQLFCIKAKIFCPSTQ